MLDEIDETIKMKLKTKVRSKKIKPGVTGILYSSFSAARYAFLFKDEIAAFKEHYTTVTTVCFIDIGNNNFVTLPVEDLEEIE